MPCQQHVRQLAARYEELRALGAQVAVLAPGRPAEATALASRVQAPFPVLADPSGATLDALGFTTGLGVIRRSGAVAVDRDGRVRYVHHTLNPSRALAWGALVETLQALQG